MNRYIALLTTSTAALLIMAPLAIAQGLNLTIEGVRNAKGSVIVMVFDSAKGYNNLDWSKAIDLAELPAKPGKLTHRFSNLNAGPYAVLLFHDENGDQDLNYTGNTLHEGTGASNVTARNQYPNFAEAAVPPGNVTVRLYYDK